MSSGGAGGEPGGGRSGPLPVREAQRARATAASHQHRTLQPLPHLSDSLTVPRGALKVNMLI